MLENTSSTQSGAKTSTSRFSLLAGAEAGMLAGVVFLLLEYLSTVLLGADSPLGPARVTLRSILHLTPGTAAEPYLLAVLVVHFGLSVVTTQVLGGIIYRMVRHWAITFGVLYGLLLYTINFFAFAFWLPGITAASDLFMFINYMIYGGLAAWLYRWRVAARARQ